MLELKNMCAGYGDKKVLYDVSATFHPGEFVSIIGANGCGKTTLLKAILGMVQCESGTILLDHVQTNQMKNKELAKRIAYVAQGKNVPDMTVAQMVLHGRFAHLSYPRIYKKKDKEIAANVMEQMGVAQYAHRKMAQLSGGMRQNVYIAMALAQDTEYMLMDEPTTYLDIANRIGLMKTMTQLADNGKGVIAVLHDMLLAMEYSHRIVVLKEGQIVMDASPEQVYHSDVIKDVFGVEIRRTKTEHGFSYYYVG